MKKNIYADNAATTKLDDEALRAMLPFLQEDYCNPSQPYSFARRAKEALKKAREGIATCINAAPEEIYFTSGGTEGDNWVIKCAGRDNVGKNVVITSLLEHHAVLNACAAIKHFGDQVIYVKPTKTGTVTAESLLPVLSSKVRLVSIMMANNEIGSLQPIKALCEISHKYNALFHTDAVQAIGHTNIDVRELDIDLLTASAHKFNGPKGVGFVYVRKGTELTAWFNGGMQEKGLRAGTENIASIVGMAVALRNNIQDLEKNTRHIKMLETVLLDKLNEYDICFRRNCGEDNLPGIISLSFPNRDGETILHRLDLLGISVSTGAACDSVNTQISHVLQAINLDEKYAKGTIRISLGKNNTVDDVLYIAESLKKILR